MIDLKRKPSASRIAAEKYKTKPINKPRLSQRSLAVGIPFTTSSSQPQAVATTSSATCTVTKQATEKETNDVIKQLLDIGAMHDADTTDKNAELVSLVPTTL